MSWDKTKNIYINWLAQTKLKKIFSKKILYKNELSLWWLTKLVDRDYINDQNWYIKLNNILKKKNITSENFFLFKNFLKFLRSLISKIIFYYLFKIFLKNKMMRNDYKTSIYVTHSNLIEHKNITIDKQLGKFGMDQKSEILYLINLEENVSTLFNIFKIRKKLKKIPYDYSIINRTIGPLKILNIYFSVIFKIICLKKELNKKNFFILNNLNCSRVLLNQLLCSFFGSIQKQILIGERLLKILNSIKCNNFLTYLEFFPTSRAIYYFVNKSKIKNIVSINHGNTSNNDLFFCLKKKEFSITNNFKDFSPRPNFYTTKGELYFKKLAKIFPKKQIFLTGSFKIELEKNFKLATNCKNNNQKRLFLVCGLNDYRPFLYLLNKINLNNFKVFLLPHPVAKHETIDYFKKNSNFTFEIKRLHDKPNFFKKNDLIIFGDSSIGLELAFFKHNVMRVYHKKFIPTFDFDNFIPFSSNTKKLSFFLNGSKFKKDKRKIEKSYFYKFDMKASKRLNDMLNLIK